MREFGVPAATLRTDGVPGRRRRQVCCSCGVPVETPPPPRLSGLGQPDQMPFGVSEETDGDTVSDFHLFHDSGSTKFAGFRQAACDVICTDVERQCPGGLRLQCPTPPVMPPSVAAAIRP